jgi:hypothetical protein
LETASNELIDKFHQNAVNVFPSGCTRVIGIASAFGAIRIYFIDYSSASNTKFSTSLYRQYGVQRLTERVRFIVDMFKVMRWMHSISEPNERYHLCPGIRMETRNHHHVIWTSQGLLKEYNHRINYTVQLNRINQIYNTVPKPLHVEYGYVNNNPSFPNSCMITRLGYMLTKENINRFRLTPDEVMKQVSKGLEELHAIGFAHCDVCIANVFIDSDGIVFLDDLEYLTSINDPPPHKTRLPYGTNEGDVVTALTLDTLQYQQFCNHVASEL